MEFINHFEAFINIIQSLIVAFDIHIEEDSILWDCATMGNMICGKGM